MARRHAPAAVRGVVADASPTAPGAAGGGVQRGGLAGSHMHATETLQGCRSRCRTSSKTCIEDGFAVHMQGGVVCIVALASAPDCWRPCSFHVNIIPSAKSNMQCRAHEQSSADEADVMRAVHAVTTARQGHFLFARPVQHTQIGIALPYSAVAGLQQRLRLQTR